MMMDIKYIAFIVAFVAVLEHTQGQITCGQFQCAPNALCVNGLCVCPGGYIGAGRFLCVLQTTRCPCISFGDPHTILYDAQKVRSTISCDFKYTGYSSTPLTPATTCVLDITMNTVRRPTQSNPFRQFVQSLIVSATQGASTVNFVIGVGGVTGLTVVGAGITAVETTVGQIRQVSMAACDTVVGFNPTLGSAFVDAPVTATFTSGICGNCDRVQNDISFDSISGATTAEKDLAVSLRQLSTAQTTNDSAVCSTLITSINTAACLDDATLIAAVRACGVFIMDSTYRDCLFTNNIGNKENLFFTFDSCVSSYCIPSPASACNLVASLSSPNIACTLPTGYTCV